LKLLAERLGLPRHALSIVSSQRGRDKVVQMAGLDPRETERRLAS